MTASTHTPRTGGQASRLAVEHPDQWRLARVEVYNWGTFSNLHGFDVARRGHLITGASGSGKSSLLDAIATVLVPQSRISYNAAALDTSARRSDRSRVSYLRGAWSRQLDDATGETTTRTLRSGAVSSGILLRYHRGGDPGPDEDLTLIALFHLRRGATAGNEVKDRYLAVRGTPTLADFVPHLGHGIDDRALKAAWPDALMNSPTHGAFIHRIGKLLEMGAEPAQSLELLHRTQSAKNLGSLNQLFRDFMLDRPKSFDVADQAVGVFQDLSQAYRGVLESRAQRDALRALRDPVARFVEHGHEAELAHALESALTGWRDRRLLAMCRRDAAAAQEEVARLEQELTARKRTVDDLQSQRDGARARLDRVGGAQLQAEQARLDAARADVERIAEDHDRAARRLGSVGVSMPATAAEFEELRQEAERDAATAGRRGEADERLERAAGELERRRQRLDDVKERVRQLVARPDSAVDGRLDAARADVARLAGLDAAQLPFAAELIGVRDDYADWTGAIERVLRPLATVLLVPDEHLIAVRRAIDGHHLNTRLVYEAVPASPAPAPRPASPDSVVNRVEIRPGPFAGWLAHRISERFDYVCVDGPDGLADVERGVTLAGQVKRGPRRYEKDDRTRVDDPSRWVLSSGRQAKLDRLDAEAAHLRERFDAARAEADRVRTEGRRQERRRDTIADVTAQRWARFDRDAAARAVADIKARIASLTAGNRDLSAASDDLARAERQLSDAGAEVSTTTQALGAAKAELDKVSGQRDALEAKLTATEPGPEAALDTLEQRSRARHRTLSRDTIDVVAREIGDELHEEATRAERARSRAASEFDRLAAEFARAWPATAAGLGTAIEYRDDYERILTRIERGKLPEYVAKFRELLRKQSQEQTATLRSILGLAVSEVRDKVAPINESLRRSPFDRDRYLQIRVDDARTREVRDFLDQLKAVTSGSWDESTEAEDEERFHLLDGVIGHLGSDDPRHRAWRTRVLDSRLHVGFVAEEVTPRGVVVNTYDSSAGLSGGQRQKLVIFCLAAALRYRLARPDHLAPDYGTVILDEAFDKADSVFTRMAMDVFLAFGFHMVLATPLKLLQTLGDYVGAVSRVECHDHRVSSVGTTVIDDLGEDAPDEGQVATPDGTSAPRVGTSAGSPTEEPVEQHR